MTTSSTTNNSSNPYVNSQFGSQQTESTQVRKRKNEMSDENNNPKRVNESHNIVRNGLHFNCNEACSLTDSALMELISKVPLLEEFYLPFASEQLTDESFKNLINRARELKNMIIFKGENISIKKIAELIRNAQNLKKLNLRTIIPFEINEELLASLNSSLEKLTIQSAENLNSKHLKFIADQCVKLTSLNLEVCEENINEGLVYLIKNNPRLTSLKLHMITQLDNETVKNIIPHLKQLKQLTIMSCEQITDDAFLDLTMDDLPSLQELNLSGTSITDKTIVMLVRYLALDTLQVLKLRDCEKIKDLSKIFYFPNLKELDIAGINFIQLSRLIEMKKLNNLDISFLDFPASFIVQIVQQMPNLKKLNAAGIQPIEELELIKNTNPDLELSFNPFFE